MSTIVLGLNNAEQKLLNWFEDEVCGHLLPYERNQLVEKMESLLHDCTEHAREDGLEEKIDLVKDQAYDGGYMAAKQKISDFIRGI